MLINESSTMLNTDGPINIPNIMYQMSLGNLILSNINPPKIPQVKIINKDKKIFIVSPSIMEIKKADLSMTKKIIDVISLNKRFSISARETIIPYNVIILQICIYLNKKEFFYSLKVSKWRSRPDSNRRPQS